MKWSGGYTDPRFLGDDHSSQPDVIDFSGTPNSGPAPLNVHFTSTIAGGSVTEWKWDFGDGSTSAEKDPNHVYRTPGIYTVSLTATGPEGTDEEIKVNYIEVNQPNGIDLTGIWAHFFSGNGRLLWGKFEVENIGNENAGRFSVGFYLSDDGITLGELLQKTTLWRGLRADRNRTAIFYNFSLDSLIGQFIIAVVDCDDQIIEANKGNNAVPVEILQRNNSRARMRSRF